MERIHSMLKRINDKLAAIDFPYYFNESVKAPELAKSLFATKTENASSPEAAVWWPLRDAVVFAEDACINCYEPSERAAFKTRNPIEFLMALVAYVEALGKVTNKAGQLVFLSCASPIIQASCKFIALNKDFVGMDDDELRNKNCIHTLTLIGAVCDAAVACEVKYSCGTEEVNISHKQWLRDQDRTIVTSLEPLAVLNNKEGPNLKKASSSSSKDATKDAENLRALLEPIFVFRGIPYPESSHAALSDVLRLVQALPVKGGSGTGNGSDDAGIAALMNAVPSPCGPKSGKGKPPPVEDAAKVLRLLYTLDLKSLQDEVNSQIGELQNLTATCKTDPRLGRVGR